MFVLTSHPEDAVPADGIRLHDNPGGRPIRLQQPEGVDRVAAVNVRYRPWRQD